MLRATKEPIKFNDFSVARDGGYQWVFTHFGRNGYVAVFTGENATQALRALKVALVTHRLSS